MRKLKTTSIVAFVLILLASCGGGMSSHSPNAEGFEKLEKELKTKFGENASYTDLSVGFDENIGIWMGTTVTDNPESLKMGEWNMSQSAWKQNSEVTLEISEGSVASDFMFQLNDQFSLKKLGELVEVSSEKLKAEKKIENPTLSLAFIKFPKNGDASKAQYVVQLEPKSGGTSFNFSYELNGEFIEMDY